MQLFLKDSLPFVAIAVEYRGQSVTLPEVLIDTGLVVSFGARSTMVPIQYTNRMGQTFYLCQGVTKSGKPRFYFARELRDTAVEEIPHGYEARESVNGVVSLAKVRKPVLQPGEVDVVKKAVSAHPKARNYRVEAKGKAITVFESNQSEFGDLIRSMAERLGFGLGESAISRMEEETMRRGQYAPIMRFTLSGPEGRLFKAERMRYSGETHWITVAYDKLISELATELIPVLGKDEYFELY